MADRILNHLCDYALKLSYRDLPKEVVRRAKHMVLDTVGCALGGAESPPASAWLVRLRPRLRGDLSERGCPVIRSPRAPA